MESTPRRMWVGRGTAESRASSTRPLDSCGEQLLQVLVELADRAGISAEEHEVPIDRVKGPELGVGNQPPLGLTIGRGEEHIRRHRHDKGLGLDAAQGLPQVAAGMTAHIAASHFQAMHRRSLGSMTRKYAYLKLRTRSSMDGKPRAPRGGWPGRSPCSNRSAFILLRQARVKPS